MILWLLKSLDCNQFCELPWTVRIPCILHFLSGLQDNLIMSTTCNFVLLVFIRWGQHVVLLSFQQCRIACIEICLFLCHLWLTVSCFMSWAVTSWYWVQQYTVFRWLLWVLVTLLSNSSQSFANLPPDQKLNVMELLLFSLICFHTVNPLYSIVKLHFSNLNMTFYSSNVANNLCKFWYLHK